MVGDKQLLRAGSLRVDLWGWAEEVASWASAWAMYLCFQRSMVSYFSSSFFMLLSASNFTLKGSCSSRRSGTCRWISWWSPSGEFRVCCRSLRLLRSGREEDLALRAGAPSELIQQNGRLQIIQSTVSPATLCLPDACLLHQLVYNWMWDKISQHLPYLLLLLANLGYLYVHGFGPLKTHPKLFLYNFLIFLLLGVVLFFKASYLLHKWFVLGEGDTRQKVKAKLKELLQLWQTVWNYLRPGNETNLIYLYAILAAWTFIEYLIPRFLMGIFLALLYEITNILNSRYSTEVQQLKARFWAEIEQIKRKLPRYEGEE